MDIAQIALVVTLVVATVVLGVIGYQLFYVLRETKNLLVRLNRVVGGLERMSTSVESGFNEVAGFVGGARSIFSLFEIFKGRRGNASDKSET